MSLRIGFLGAGLIATFHSKMLRGCGVDHERAGVYDPDRTRAEAFVAAAGGHVADAPADVLADSDAVYVCTWTSEHEALVRAAVDAGVAVFLEKPLAPDVDGARRVADLLAGSGLPHQVGLVLRHSPAYALAADLLDGDDVGRVMTAVFRDDQALPTGARYASTWRADPAKAGRGVLIEHSIHDVDVLERLLGPAERVSARERYFHEIDRIEDLVVATFDLASGAVATLTTVWHDLTARNSIRRLEIHAERAHVCVVGDWFGPVSIETDDGTRTWEGDDLLEECRRRGIEPPHPEATFLRAVAAGGRASPDAAVARRAHEVVDALYRSAAAGGAVIDVGVDHA